MRCRTSRDTSTWHQPTGVLEPRRRRTPRRWGWRRRCRPRSPTRVCCTARTRRWNGSYSDGQLPLTLYNNYVRWVWVYVQYLKADGTNLSLDPRRGIAEYPQRPKRGVAPPDLHPVGRPDLGHQHDHPDPRVPRRGDQRPAAVLRARQRRHRRWLEPVLPPRRLPRGQIAPQKEVLFPAVVTGILTSGSPPSPSLTDINRRHRRRVRAAIEDISSGVWDAASTGRHRRPGVDRLGGRSPTTVAAGGATYEDIANNGGSAANIWSILARPRGDHPQGHLSAGRQPGVASMAAVDRRARRQEDRSMGSR